MNQILTTKNTEDLNASFKLNRAKSKSIFLRYQLILSTLFLYFFVVYYFNTTYIMHEEEKKSQQLLKAYNITKLYSSINIPEKYIPSPNDSLIIGMIEIKKLNIVYPILSDSTDDFLKISPCRFFGPNANEFGNLCIAGHNYDNDRFFSKINTLKNNDIILIYDNTGSVLKYKVFSVYETTNDDNECTRQIENIKEITLVTCNNMNGNRIIVKAKV